MFSYQADNRRLAERSRQIVKERGWQERIVALNQQPPNVDPRVYTGFREPWSQPNARNAYYSGPAGPTWRDYHRSGRRDHDRATTSPPEIQIVRSPREPWDANPESRPNQTERGKETKPAVSEVRFTVPRLDPTRQTAGVPQSRKPVSRTFKVDIHRKRHDQELQEAMDKLERLKSNRDEAERAKNYALKSDLEYYAIPDLESRIKKLKQAHEGDESDGKGALAEKQGRVPQTAVETDSEGSEGPEPKAEDVSDSETGSAALDLDE